MIGIRCPRSGGVLLGSLVASIILMSPIVDSARGTAAGPASVTALPGYQIRIFARGTTGYSHPDSVVSNGQAVFVGFQNTTLPDGTDGKSSTVVEYSAAGRILHTFAVSGHNDGLRIDPATHLVWAVSNEDANARITSIDPNSGSEKVYTFAKPPHGGGFDDLAFINGMVFISASNPTLNKSGINTAPALDMVTLGTDGIAHTVPVLMGDGAATDRVAHGKVALNLIDPDSLSLDLKGDLVLDNQAGSQLLLIAHPGEAGQTVSSLTVGTQVDDTVWPVAPKGSLLVSDTGSNTIYAISSDFVLGSAFSATPGDSGVAGMVARLDPATGILTPVVIGLDSPHGMAFVPDPHR